MHYMYSVLYSRDRFPLEMKEFYNRKKHIYQRNRRGLENRTRALVIFKNFLVNSKYFLFTLLL